MGKRLRVSSESGVAKLLSVSSGFPVPELSTSGKVLEIRGIRCNFESGGFEVVVYLVEPNSPSFMVPSPRPRGVLFWSVVFAVFGFGFSVFAEDWAVNGRPYVKVRVLEVTPSTVTIFHSGGMSQLNLADLSEELQERFNFNAGNAQQWSQKAEAELATTKKKAEILNLAAIESHRSSVAVEKPVGGNEQRAGPRVLIADLSDSEVVEYRRGVDLRAAFETSSGKVKRPGKHPGCGVFAVAGALEFELNRMTGSPWLLADSFLLWAVRDMFPGLPIDDGSHLYEVISALQTYGVPDVQNYEIASPETHGWVRDSKPEEGSFDQFRPTERSMAAARFKDVVPVLISPEDPRLIDLLVALLNSETPVIVGVGWPHPNSLKTNNLLRDQVPADMRGHSVVLAGYRNPEGRAGQTTFIFRNSYGDSWGFGGYGLMDERYLKNYFISAFYLTFP